MKETFVVTLFAILLGACNSEESNINLNPEIELLNKELIKFENEKLIYPQLDSILKKYLQNIPPNLKDSIRVNLIVNTNEVTLDKVSKVKVSLRKNRILKVNYKPKNDER